MYVIVIEQERNMWVTRFKAATEAIGQAVMGDIMFKSPKPEAGDFIVTQHTLRGRHIVLIGLGHIRGDNFSDLTTAGDFVRAFDTVRSQIVKPPNDLAAWPDGVPTFLWEDLHLKGYEAFLEAFYTECLDRLRQKQ